MTALSRQLKADAWQDANLLSLSSYQRVLKLDVTPLWLPRLGGEVCSICTCPTRSSDRLFLGDSGIEQRENDYWYGGAWDRVFIITWGECSKQAPLPLLSWQIVQMSGKHGTTTCGTTCGTSHSKRIYTQ